MGGDTLLRRITHEIGEVLLGDIPEEAERANVVHFRRLPPSPRSDTTYYNILYTVRVTDVSCPPHRLPSRPAGRPVLLFPLEETIVNDLRIPDLADKVFLVTGASTGIGAAVAKELGRQGAKVAVHYYASEAEARAVVDEIGRVGADAFLVRGNVAECAANTEIVEKTAAHFGRIDGLINNAGGMLGRIPVEESNETHDRAVVDLNSHSVVWMTRAALPWLRKQGGVVINTTSIAARNGGGGGAILYAAAKGFVSTITKGLAKELVGDGIRVNAV
ncbi:MAG: SDR family NAD(P)-dependent oxidoreductase, partial [Bauldia sp.]|nr:SDR family NAD(P)-dependent oxidoreductase [Bauldia sp.]